MRPFWAPSSLGSLALFVSCSSWGCPLSFVGLCLCFVQCFFIGLPTFFRGIAPLFCAVFLYEFGRCPFCCKAALCVSFGSSCCPITPPCGFYPCFYFIQGTTFLLYISVVKNCGGPRRMGALSPNRTSDGGEGAPIDERRGKGTSVISRPACDRTGIPP